MIKKPRDIPSVNNILEIPEMKTLQKFFPRFFIVNAIRAVLVDVRKEIKNKTDIQKTDLIKAVKHKLEKTANVGIKRAINATGIILHTGLGRAVISKNARERIYETAGYCTLQVDRTSGKRGKRDAYIKLLLCKLTKAEDATVVNNNAAATILVLNTLAKNKEVIISRGQLVEIGGAFRLPDVMKQSNATMIEVGTTNCTHLHDYKNAITENTALLLNVHTSNYKISGFTKEVSIEELIKLGRKCKLPVIHDVGSGALINLSRYGFDDEPIVQESIKKGTDLVLFSADKLVGKRKYIELIRKNPLARALRIDKLSLSALEATLELFLDESTLLKNHPTLRMLTIPIKFLELKAHSLLKKLKSVKGLSFTIENNFSELGSGSLPTKEIATKVIAVYSKKIPASELCLKLRMANPPIFTRIETNKVIIDMRTIQDGEEDIIAETLAKIANR